MAASMFNSKEDKDEKRRPSYMPTRGLAAVLNQGLATLGEKLGNLSLIEFNQQLYVPRSEDIAFSKEN